MPPIFFEEDLKLLANSLIVLPAFSKRGSPYMSEKLLAVSAQADLSVPSNIFGQSPLLLPASDNLTARLAAFLLGALACPSVPYDDTGSKIIGGTDLLHLEESSPCPLNLMMSKVLTG